MKKIYFKLFLSLLAFFGLQVQSIAQGLSGKLVDTNGNPVSGAKIELLNQTGHHTYTNRAGEYEILAQVGEPAMVTTADLYAVQISLNDQQVIELAKKDAPVNIGLGLVKNTGVSTLSASTVFANRLEKNEGHIKASNALYGELLGLTVLERSGTTDYKDAVLNMRGIGTPMILVDGFERDIDDINVEEIESITLLKDAAALALYGFRGSKGVLNITTKRGKYKSLEIDFSYNHNLHFAQSSTPMVDAHTYALGLNEALANDGLPDRYNAYQLEAFRTASEPLIYPNVDWAQETLTDMYQSNSYNFQVCGGGEVVRYYTHVGYDTDNGFIGLDAPDPAIPNQYQYSNLNVRSNLDIALTKTTLVQINLLGKLKETSSPMQSYNSLMSTIYSTPAAAFPVVTENGEWGSSTTWEKNPVADLMSAGFYKYHTRTLWTDLAIEQNLDAITKGLKARVSLAYDSDARIYERKNKSYRTETLTPVFDDAGNPADVIYTQIGEDEASYGFGSSLSDQWQKTSLQGLIDYNRSFGASTIGIGYLTEMTNIIEKGIQRTYNRLNNSMFVSYAYQNRYMLDASFTVAASNMLDPERKWGYLPAVSAAWLISNESFLKESDKVSFLKLRASYGLLGNDNVGFDTYKQEYKSGSSVRFGNFVSTPTLVMGALPVLNLTYAKTQSMNVGVEGTFFKNLSLMVELYHKRVTDILTGVSNVNSSVLGVSPGYLNNGERIYKGIETGLAYSKRTANWKYGVGGQFTFNKSEIVNMNEMAWKNDFNKATGHSVGQLFGFEAIGFFKDQTDIDNSDVHTFTQVKPGDIKYKDQDNNGIIDQYDRIAIGHSSYMPEMYFSFDLNLEYRNLGMNLMFQGVGNYSSIQSTTNIYRPLVGNKNISQHYYDNRWVSGNEEAALYPRLTTEINENNLLNSTVWLQDRSYLKLRCAELYYNVPQQWAEKVKLENAKLFVRGYNLFSMDNMRVGDPEGNGMNYPLYTTINIGAKLSF